MEFCWAGWGHYCVLGLWGLVFWGGGDGFEGVDGEGVEEFVGDYEGAFVFFCCFWDVLVDGFFFWLIWGIDLGLRTVWEESDVFYPNYGDVEVFAGACVADFCFFHCGIAA